MSRLAKFKKEELVEALWERVLEKPTDQAEIKLADRKSALSLKVYDAYLSSEVPPHPKVVGLRKYFAIDLYFYGTSYKSMVLGLSKDKHFWSHTDDVWASSDDSEISKNICKEAESIYQAEEKLSEKRGQQRAKINGAVMSLNTHSQFRENWPEAYQVLCSLGYGPDEAKAEYLPAIKTEDLNALCNLPPIQKD